MVENVELLRVNQIKDSGSRSGIYEKKAYI